MASDERLGGCGETRLRGSGHRHYGFISGHAAEVSVDTDRTYLNGLLTLEGFFDIMTTFVLWLCETNTDAYTNSHIYI